MRWITLLVYLMSQQSLAYEAPAAFKATYEIEKYGSTVAVTTLTFKQTGDQINYISSSKAEGLAAMFTSDTITESSTLKLAENNKPLYLLGYAYSRKKKPEKNQTINISWDKNNTASIISQYKNSRTEFTEPYPVWDKHSVQLALMDDMISAKVNDILSYRVIEKKSITDYNFEYLGDETININHHHYQTKKIKRIHASETRTTTMWLATELANLPVAIEQHKDGELNWQMKLKDINTEAN